MSYKLSFGKHEGKTFEWVFFNAPGYAEWIYDNRIHRQHHNMDEAEGDYFAELFRRASVLQGTCSVCKKRALTRMGLTFRRGADEISAVRFYCDECEYQGGSPTEYHPPSFFLEAYQLRLCEQKRITGEVKGHFIGADGNLTQKKMEAFFRTNEFFARARPYFFQAWESEVVV
jgi:hypothetical protein